VRGSTPPAPMALAMMPIKTPSSLDGCSMINLIIARCRFGREENWSFTPVELVCVAYADMPPDTAPAGLGWSAELGLEGFQRTNFS
jgi:hypothetical protein